jgi:hypothetical protein
MDKEERFYDLLAYIAASAKEMYIDPKDLCAAQVIIRDAAAAGDVYGRRRGGPGLP